MSTIDDMLSELYREEPDNGIYNDQNDNMIDVEQNTVRVAINKRTKVTHHMSVSALRQMTRCRRRIARVNTKNKICRTSITTLPLIAEILENITPTTDIYRNIVNLMISIDSMTKTHVAILGIKKTANLSQYILEKTDQTYIHAYGTSARINNRDCKLSIVYPDRFNYNGQQRSSITFDEYGSYFDVIIWRYSTNYSSDANMWPYLEAAINQRTLFIIVNGRRNSISTVLNDLWNDDGNLQHLQWGQSLLCYKNSK